MIYKNLYQNLDIIYKNYHYYSFHYKFFLQKNHDYDNDFLILHHLNYTNLDNMIYKNLYQNLDIIYKNHHYYSFHFHYKFFLQKNHDYDNDFLILHQINYTNLDIIH